jgi:hypothetical protein
MAKEINLDRRLRTAAVLILVALILEIVSLLWTSPFAFFLFILGTGLLMLIGVLIFLFEMVFHGGPPSPETAGED